MSHRQLVLWGAVGTIIGLGVGAVNDNIPVWIAVGIAMGLGMGLFHGRLEHDQE